MTSFGKRRFEARQGHFQANLFGLSFEAVKVCDSRIAVLAPIKIAQSRGAGHEKIGQRQRLGAGKISQGIAGTLQQLPIALFQARLYDETIKEQVVMAHRPFG